MITDKGARTSVLHNMYVCNLVGFQSGMIISGTEAFSVPIDWFERERPECTERVIYCVMHSLSAYQLQF